MSSLEPKIDSEETAKEFERLEDDDFKGEVSLYSSNKETGNRTRKKGPFSLMNSSELC